MKAGKIRQNKNQEKTMATIATSAQQVVSSSRVQHRSTVNVVLWTLQILLAALFLFAGGMKLVAPIEMMTKQMPLPGPFLRFIGCAEILGAMGLVLPWGFRIRRELTPIAAAGLVIIMAGATGLMLRQNGLTSALMPFSVGCLVTIVGYGRWSLLRSFRAA
jgi:uncharacterized membrane protein YphA (DoxX/SURF4 family)